jgi:hypothetical protein
VAGHSNSGDHSLTHAQGQVLKDTAVSRDSVSAAEAADLFGASAANSAPSMIDRRAVDGRTWSAFAKNCLRLANAAHAHVWACDMLPWATMRA